MAFNILLVDDSDTMRAVIKKVVAMSGVPVGEFHEGANGKEALAVLEDAWVDVILSDINMPEMGGMELLRQLKESEVYRNIPVIFITTESSHTRLEEAQALGVSGYITKPFVPETIKKVLYEVLEAAYDQEIDAAQTPGRDEGEEDVDF